MLLQNKFGTRARRKARTTRSASACMFMGFAVSRFRRKIAPLSYIRLDHLVCDFDSHALTLLAQQLCPGAYNDSPWLENTYARVCNILQYKLLYL